MHFTQQKCWFRHAKFMRIQCCLPRQSRQGGAHCVEEKGSTRNLLCSRTSSCFGRSSQISSL